MERGGGKITAAAELHFGRSVTRHEAEEDAGGAVALLVGRAGLGWAGEGQSMVVEMEMDDESRRKKEDE